jgi:hypothetical protein
MYLITTEEAEKLVERWENGQLEKEEWTHEMHLLVGCAMVIRYKKNALAEMRQRIIRHNEAIGTLNSDNSGYHETLTVYWLWVIRTFLKEKNLTAFDEITLDELLLEENMVKRNEWDHFYKLETIKSVAARRHFVQPDFGKMLEIEYFIW